MELPEIDKRLVGFNVNDITDKFIRENATEEELSVIRKVIIDEEHSSFIRTGSVNHEDSLAFAKDLLDELVSKRNSVITELAGDGAEVTYNVEVERTIKPVDHLRAQWQYQIREHNVYQKEYNEWLRLNEKFGEETQ